MMGRIVQSNTQRMDATLESLRSWLMSAFGGVNGAGDVLCADEVLAASFMLLLLVGSVLPTSPVLPSAVLYNGNICAPCEHEHALPLTDCDDAAISKHVKGSLRWTNMDACRPANPWTLAGIPTMIVITSSARMTMMLQQLVL